MTFRRKVEMPLLKTGLMASLLITLQLPLLAHTIDVDIPPGHSTNQFVPTETLGAGIDRIATKSIDPLLAQPVLAKTLSAGWQTGSYRQNTAVLVKAWHWNPEGTWSDPKGEGYFTGSANLGKPIHFSYGYALPHRGFTRNDGTGNAGFSRLTDGDENTYWKSNPYLTERFTHEPDSVHPQWIILDLSSPAKVDTIRIDWAAPFATQYLVQYCTGDDPIHSPTRGAWQTFPRGLISSGRGGVETISLSPEPVAVHYLRI